MSWNIGENRNLLLKLKWKLGLSHVVLTTPNTSPKKYHNLSWNATVAGNWKVDSKNKISWLKWTIFNGIRKVCVSFKTDMDNFNTVVYRYWTNIYVENTEKELKSTEYNTKDSYLKEYIYWVTLTYCLGGALYWMKQLFIVKVNFIKNGCYLSSKHFSILPQSKI